VHEQTLEHHLDVVGFPEDVFDPRAAAPGADNREIAAAGIAKALPVEHERHARNEVRLADDELPALLDLDDRAVAQ
jgi:hypothetical protein